MTYPEFETALECLRRFEQERQKLEEVIKVISPTSTGVVEFGGQFMEDYIALLSLAVGDENNCWINWYVFECDFGANPHAAHINGKEIIVDSPQKLYDIILS